MYRVQNREKESNMLKAKKEKEINYPSDLYLGEPLKKRTKRPFNPKTSSCLSGTAFCPKTYSSIALQRIDMTIEFEIETFTNMMVHHAEKSVEHRKQKDEESSFEIDLSYHSGISHENSECVKRDKSEKLKKRKRRVYNTKSKGNWNPEEDVRFVIFLLENRESFENKGMRRSNKVFKQMAKFVKTRCSEQCRSHHQKYEKKYVTFDAIISSIKSRIFPNLPYLYEMTVENLKNSIEEISQTNTMSLNNCMSYSILKDSSRSKSDTESLHKSIGNVNESLKGDENRKEKMNNKRTKSGNMKSKKNLQYTEVPFELHPILSNEDHEISVSTCNPLHIHIKLFKF